ncbi:MAG TPA: hypothetical protein VF075_10675 [Pyrinomonadaceae bacterium]
MKRLLSIKFLVLTLLVAGISVAAVERPFAATSSGIATFIFDGNGNPIGANVTGSGQATHLGRFTSVGQVFFTPDPDNPIILHPSGQATLTAADGDKVNVVVTDGSLDVTTGISTGHFRFTGGTGRFANATGITSLVVEQNFVTGGYELTIVGNIDY